MKEIHYYECEYCGKHFEDEDECRIHELLEKTDTSKFRAYHYLNGELIPWPWGASEYERMNALWVADEKSWDFLDNYIQHELGYSSPMEGLPTPTKWPVAVFNSDSDTWVNVEEAYEQAKALKEKYLDNPVKM